jgi:hypothetical protein
VNIKTNHKPRLLIDGSELTDKEAAEFDYMDDVMEGTFFRYKGIVYSLDQFMRIDNNTELSDWHSWHGYHSDSYFSGVLVKFTNDCDMIIVATYYS